jgi:hypothetical protein
VVISNPFAATFVNPPGAGAFDSGGNLWVPNSGGNTIVEFSAAQVEQGGTPEPIITIANPSGRTFISQPSALAFDSTGNLWVVNQGNPNNNNATIIEYTAQQLTSNPQDQPFTFAPEAIITVNPTGSVALSRPYEIAFDGAGNLWVSNFLALAAYSPAQQVSGSPTPAITISLPPRVPSAQGIVFDKNGNLWVGSAATGGEDNSPGELLQYSKAQLAVSGSPTPAVTITPNALTVFGGFNPKGVVFDLKGNLWVANSSVPGVPGNGNFVFEFAAADITESGSPTPVVSISNPANLTFISSPLSVLFDSAGDLVVINNAFLNPIVEYGAAQIIASGSPSPESVLNNPSANSGLGIPVGVALDSSGRLWESVKSFATGGQTLSSAAVLAFSKSDLQHTGSPKPAIVITDPTTLPNPSGITFDSQGNLWVANTLIVGDYDDASFVKFSAASIASGTPEPIVVITNPTSSGPFPYSPTKLLLIPKATCGLLETRWSSTRQATLPPPGAQHRLRSSRQHLAGCGKTSITH